VADALSRLSPESSAEGACHVVVPSQPKWLEDVVASYSENSHAKELLSKLAVNKDSVPGFSLVNGLLRYKNRIWVGCDIELQQQLLKAFHSSPVVGHSGVLATYQKLKQLFAWKMVEISSPIICSILQNLSAGQAR
jgi:hypothetical protein